MLNELKKLPPLRVANELQANGRRKNVGAKRIATTNSRQQVQQINPRRKGAAVLIKDNMINTSTLSTETATPADDSDVSNPISVLLRIQQANKQPEPIYTVVEERGQGRRKEFVMQANCSGFTGLGVGNSKKLAKREAAKSVLDQMGYVENASVNVVASQAVNVNDKSRKVTFTETKVYTENAGQVGGAAGRQLVPGILLMKGPENNRSEWRFSCHFGSVGGQFDQ